VTDTTLAEPSAVDAPLEALAPVPHDRFPCFDGLRALAAFAVLVYHVTTTYNLETLHSDTWQWTQRLGNFGVSTFFLISGFLLYRPFVTALFADREPPKLIPFWGRRALRIYPAYWVAITVAAYGMAIITISNFQIFFSTYLLLQNYRAGLTLAGLGVEWTLVIEVSFYIALPFIAWFLRSINRPGASARTKLRTQLLGLAGLYAIAMLVRIWRLWALNAKPARGGGWFPIAQVGQWLPGYLDWFALGMLLAVGSAWLARGGQIPMLARALARYPAASWLLSITCFWVALQLNTPASIYVRVTRIQDFGIAFLYGLVAFFLILPAVFGDQEQGRIRGFLRSRVMATLGIVSYGIYLWHIIWVHQLKTWFHDGTVGGNIWVWFAIVITLTLITATLSYLWVERPAIRWSHKQWPGSRRPTPAASSDTAAPAGTAPTPGTVEGS
jgi:peptidoglycan/LPS O-acetylase OafA/YrhL